MTADNASPVLNAAHRVRSRLHVSSFFTLHAVHNRLEKGEDVFFFCFDCQ